MAKKELSNLEKLTTYKYAALAGNVAKERGLGAAKSVLNFLRTDMDTAGEMTPGASIWANAITEVREVSPESIQSVIDAGSKQYYKAQKDATIAERVSYYGNDVLKYLSDKSKGIVKKVLGEQFGNERSGYISDKLKKAKYILQGIKDGFYKFGKSLKEKSEGIVKKYESVEKALSKLETLKMAVITRPVEDESYRSMAEGIASDLEKQYMPKAA